MIIEKIEKNANYCLDTLSNDMEKLECADDFLKAPKRKRKSDIQSRLPVKKKMSKQKIIPQMATRDDDSNFLKAKQFLDDEAEGMYFL